MDGVRAAVVEPAALGRLVGRSVGRSAREGAARRVDLAIWAARFDQARVRLLRGRVTVGLAGVGGGAHARARWGWARSTHTLALGREEKRSPANRADARGVGGGGGFCSGEGALLNPHKVVYVFLLLKLMHSRGCPKAKRQRPDPTPGVTHTDHVYT
eukprot:scaffold43398_cov61-Phaeocystis_antarctica.AAC.2